MTAVRFPLVVLLFLGWAAPAAAQEPWVDPRLRLLALRPAAALAPVPDLRFGEDDLRARRRGGLPDHGVPATPFSLQRGPGGRVEVGLLVEVRSPAALPAIRATGAEIGRVVGRIATVRAPVAAIPALSRLTSVARIEAARPLFLHNDSAMSASRVDEARRRIGAAFLGSTGRGVLVGILDSGLDYDHEDFLDAAGDPRTLFLWDQVTGRFCGPDQLRERTCITGDPAGHGTHVAGIAAGDGSAAGVDSASAFRYAGVAPDADLLAVRFSFFEADLVDGVAWLFEKADSLGRPMVVNLSLGTQMGPHDGTSLLEQALDSLSGPGRIIVTSAGNDGNADNTSPRLLELPVHARATPGPGTTATIGFTLTDYTPSSSSCSDFVLFDLWYGGDQSLTFELERPDGSSASATTGGEVVQDNAGGRIIIVAPAAPSPGNGDRNAQIEINGCGTNGPPAVGAWTLRLTTADPATEPLDLWIGAYSLGQRGFVIGNAGFDNRYAVSAPATARDVIAVGAYASRLCWPAASGGTPCIGSTFGFTQPIGDIAFFSSPGPTRDERLKPEITAPGMMVMAARSHDAIASTQLLDPAREHRVELGTSMSAPHVAGTVALLLQHDPTLTPAGVLGILTSTAAADAFTQNDYSDGSTGLPNEQWGWGKLDARAALEQVVTPGVATELWLSVRSDTIPLGATLDVRGLVIDAFGDSLSAPTSWTSSDPGVATVSQQGAVTPVALGTTTITATDGGFTESLFLEVVPPATLVVEATPLPAPERASSRAGARLPLLDLRFAVDGHEGVLVDTLGFGLVGADPAARLILVEDRNDDGLPGTNEPILADTTLAVGSDSTVVLLPTTLVIPARDTLDLVAALVLSGAVPNGATFQALFLPDLTSSIGLRSGAADLRREPAAAVASGVAGTTLLGEGEMFNLSENPIRSDARRLVLNFGAAPAFAGIYTLRGARVVDLMPLLEPSGQRIEWDLRTDRGGTVAPGIYFLIVRIGDRLARRKLIVARAFGGGDA